MGKSKLKKQSSITTDNDKSRSIYINRYQLETLADVKKQLEDRIKLQDDRWISDVRLYEDQICQEKKEIDLHKKLLLLYSIKMDLLVGLKESEAFHYKLKFDQAEDELGDFKSWFDILCQKCPSDQNQSSSNLLSDVSALQDENNFIRNQLREMENQYTDQLRLKNEEIKLANEKVTELLASIEQLDSSNREKDDKIASLEADVTKFESEKNRMSEEIARLSKELELFSKTNGASSAQGLQSSCTSTQQKASCSESCKPSKCSVKQYSEGKKFKGSISSSLLKRCTAPSTSSDSKSNTSIRSTGSAAAHAKKESSSQVNNDQGTDRKRRKNDVVTMAGTPSLFNSSFKIPKLKSPVPASSLR